MLNLQFYVIGVDKHDPKSEQWNARIRILRNEQNVGEFSLPCTQKEAELLKPAIGKLTDTISIKF